MVPYETVHIPPGHTLVVRIRQKRTWKCCTFYHTSSLSDYQKCFLSAYSSFSLRNYNLASSWISISWLSENDKVENHLANFNWLSFESCTYLPSTCNTFRTLRSHWTTKHNKTDKVFEFTIVFQENEARLVKLMFTVR